MPAAAGSSTEQRVVIVDDHALFSETLAIALDSQGYDVGRVEFPDDTKPFGSPRLPDSDDVLAKWMGIKGDEQRLIGSANLHLPGRQVDPRKVQRDLWRLRQWERSRMERAAREASSSVEP